jgi:4'-phosphopantetheinyl transferase
VLADPAPGVVTVFAARLSAPPAAMDVLRGDTTALEQARATRFLRPDDTLRHRLGRAIVRPRLAPLVGSAPTHGPIVTGAHGKPVLASGAPAFNLSHSGDWVLCARAVDGRPRGRRRGEARARRSRCRGGDHSVARRAGAVACAGRCRPRRRLVRDLARREAWPKALGIGLTRVTDLTECADPDAAVVNAALRVHVPGERIDQWVVRPVSGLAGAAAAAHWGSGWCTVAPSPGLARYRAGAHTHPIPIETPFPRARRNGAERTVLWYRRSLARRAARSRHGHVPI